MGAAKRTRTQTRMAIRRIRERFAVPYTRLDRVAAVCAALSIPLALAVRMPLLEVVVVLFGASLVLLRVSGVISFVLAATCVANVPVAFALNRASMAERFAVFAFYFLCIGLLAHVLEDQPKRMYLQFVANSSNKQAEIDIIRRRYTRARRPVLALPVAAASTTTTHANPLPMHRIMPTQRPVSAPAMRTVRSRQHHAVSNKKIGTVKQPRLVSG